MRRFVASVLVAVVALIAADAAAQTFPSKPAKIVVAFPPGAAADTVSRLLGQKLSEMWGQPVIVDNRGGASGTIGTDLVAKSPADGHTMLMGTMGNLAANPALYTNLPFDIQRDLAPVSLVCMVHFVLVVNPSLPVKTVKELIEYAKTRPGQLNYGSSGPGGAPHLGSELFKSMAGVNLVHVPYKGSAPAMTDLLGGQLSAIIDNLPLALPYIKSGKVRALAVTGPKRVPVLPDVPTMAEAGLTGYELTNWFGLVVPAGTPREVISKINADLVKALKMPDVRERLLGMATEPVGSSPEQLDAFMKAETAKWAKVVKDAKITAE
jgi:tripartite-type tricarboxylate transporter receptor subunit TctC